MIATWENAAEMNAVMPRMDLKHVARLPASLPKMKMSRGGLPGRSACPKPHRRGKDLAWVENKQINNPRRKGWPLRIWPWPSGEETTEVPEHGGVWRNFSEKERLNWLRTNGVKTNGAAAIGKRYALALLRSRCLLVRGAQTMVAQAVVMAQTVMNKY